MNKSVVSYDRIEIVVSIATYKRPEGLRAALEALSKQNIQKDFAVVLANNAPEDKEVLEIAQAFRNRLIIEIVDVHEKGVAIVRNQGIAFARKKFPSVKWIATHDDDEQASEGWLNNLVRVGEKYSGDLVGGYTDMVQVSSNIAAQVLMGRRNDQEEGLANMLYGTCNLLIATAFLDCLGRPPFNPDFGASGGEDYEFFCFASKQGARMIWSKAKIFETWPENRLQLNGLFKRSLRKGIYMTRAEWAVYNWKRPLWNTSKALIYPFRNFIYDTLENRNFKIRLFLFVNGVSFACGRVLGFLGIQMKYYE